MKSKRSCRTVCADPAAQPLSINPAAESWLTASVHPPSHSSPVYSLLGGGTDLVMSRYMPSPVRLPRPHVRSFPDWEGGEGRILIGATLLGVPVATPVEQTHQGTGPSLQTCKRSYRTRHTIRAMELLASLTPFQVSEPDLHTSLMHELWHLHLQPWAVLVPGLGS